MAVLVGNAFYIEFNSVVIDNDFRTFDPGFEEETAEATAGGDTLRNHVPTLYKLEPSGTFVVDNDANGIAIRAVLEEGVSGNLIWGPEGNASGRPKWGALCRVKKAQVVATYDEEQELEVEWYVYTDGDLLYNGTSATF